MNDKIPDISFFDSLGSKGVQEERKKELVAVANSRDLRILVWIKVAEIAQDDKIKTPEQAAQAFYKIQGMFALNNLK